MNSHIVPAMVIFLATSTSAPIYRCDNKISESGKEQNLKFIWKTIEIAIWNMIFPFGTRWKKILLIDVNFWCRMHHQIPFQGKSKVQTQPLVAVNKSSIQRFAPLKVHLIALFIFNRFFYSLIIQQERRKSIQIIRWI